MRDIAFFSGQGANSLDFSVLDLNDEESKKILKIGSQVLGFDLERNVVNKDFSLLVKDPYLIQISTFLFSILQFEEYKRKGFNPVFFAGQSLGEISALVCSGKVNISQGFHLIDSRAKFMQECTEKMDGRMYSIFNSSVGKVQRLIDTMEMSERVFISNINTPNQLVISGKVKDIESFISYLDDQKINYFKLKTVSAFHTPFMKEASLKFLDVLKKIKFNHNQTVLYSNVTGKPYEETDSVYQKLLSSQISKPVNWLGVLEDLEERHISNYLEFGGNQTITNMLAANRKSFKEIEFLYYDFLENKVNSLKALFESFLQFGMLKIITNKNLKSDKEKEIHDIFEALESKTRELQSNSFFEFTLNSLETEKNRISRCLVIKGCSEEKLNEFNYQAKQFQRELKNYIGE